MWRAVCLFSLQEKLASEKRARETRMEDEDSVSCVYLISSASWSCLADFNSYAYDLFPQTLVPPVSPELSPTPAPALEPEPGPGPGVPMTNSEECYFCGQRVYVLERISAEGKFFHRSCFTCHQCGITLRLGGYTFDQSTGEHFLLKSAHVVPF